MDNKSRAIKSSIQDEIERLRASLVGVQTRAYILQKIANLEKFLTDFNKGL